MLIVSHFSNSTTPPYSVYQEFYIFGNSFFVWLYSNRIVYYSDFFAELESLLNNVFLHSWRKLTLSPQTAESLTHLQMDTFHGYKVIPVIKVHVLCYRFRLRPIANYNTVSQVYWRSGASVLATSATLVHLADKSHDHVHYSSIYAVSRYYNCSQLSNPPVKLCFGAVPLKEIYLKKLLLVYLTYILTKNNWRGEVIDSASNILISILKQ